MRLQNYIERHAGAVGVLFGKGPSLAAFLRRGGLAALKAADAGPAGLVLGFINDSALTADAVLETAHAAGAAVMLPVYVFANDSAAEWCHHLRAWKHVLFQPRRTVNDPTLRACAPPCERVIFDDFGGDERLRMTPRELAHAGLVAQHGTASSALQIMHIMGVRRIICVGIDGGGGLAAGVPLHYRAASSDATYATIRAVFEVAAHAMGMPLEFFGTDPAGARARLRAVRSFVYEGRHVEAGELIDPYGSGAMALVAEGLALRTLEHPRIFSEGALAAQ